MELTNWIKAHNLISMSSLEKALSLSHGSLKLNKKIPDKHKTQIISLLQQYGFDKEDSVDRITSLSTPKPDARQETKAEAIRVDTSKIYTMQKSGLCLKEGPIFQGVKLPAGTEWCQVFRDQTAGGSSLEDNLQ